MMLDVLKTNRENLLQLLNSLKTQLEQLEKWLEEGDYQGLHQALLQSSRKQRQMAGRKGEGGEK